MRICISKLMCQALACCSFYSILYAGTLEDIRTKTGWQSPNHSQRDSAYIPTLTPSELIAHLDRYHRDVVRMQVLFNEISTRGLNTWIGAKTNRHRWSSTRYISFSVKDNRNIYLFISKNNPDADRLFNLSRGTSMFITGRVRDIDKGRAWVEVMKVDL